MTAADRIREAAARLVGYETTGHGYTKTHHTITRRAALSWAACYPAATITKNGQFVARKTTGAKP
jgi:hypothetical protein